MIEHTSRRAGDHLRVGLELLDLLADAEQVRLDRQHVAHGLGLAEERAQGVLLGLEVLDPGVDVDELLIRLPATVVERPPLDVLFTSVPLEEVTEQPAHVGVRLRGRRRAKAPVNSSGIFDAVMPMKPTLTPLARMRSAQAVSFL